jgi:hypothetical protein
MDKFHYRDISLSREESDPKKVLIKDVEPILREYRTLGGSRTGSIALVGWRNHMTILLQRFLIYKGLDVIRFSSVAQAEEGCQPKMVIVNIDACAREDYNFSQKEMVAVAYTRNPAGPAVQRRGFSLVVPFPFDPNRIIYQLRGKLPVEENKQPGRTSSFLHCDLPDNYTVHST